MGAPWLGSSTQQGLVPGMPASDAPLGSRRQQQPAGGVPSLASQEAHAHSSRAQQSRGLQGGVQQRGMRAGSSTLVNAAQHNMSRPQARSTSNLTQAGSACSNQNVAASADPAMTESQLHTPAAAQDLPGGACSTSTMAPNNTADWPAPMQRQMGRAAPGSVGRRPFQVIGEPAELAEPQGRRLEVSGCASPHALAGSANPVRVHGQSQSPSDPSPLGIAQAAMHLLPIHACSMQMPTFRTHGQPALHGQQRQQGAIMPVQGHWQCRKGAVQQAEQHLHDSGSPQPQWQPRRQPVLQHMSNLGPVQPSSSAFQHGSRAPRHGRSHVLHQEPLQQAPQWLMRAQGSAQHRYSAPQQASNSGMPGCPAVHPQQLPHQLPSQYGHATDSARHSSSAPGETQGSSEARLHQQLHDQQARPQVPAHHVSSISVGRPMGSTPQSLRVQGPSDQPQLCSTAAAGRRRQAASLHAEGPAGPEPHSHAVASPNPGLELAVCCGGAFRAL